MENRIICGLKMNQGKEVEEEMINMMTTTTKCTKVKTTSKSKTKYGGEYDEGTRGRKI
jgi:hypothetical protein